MQKADQNDLDNFLLNYNLPNKGKVLKQTEQIRESNAEKGQRPMTYVMSSYHSKLSPA